MKYKKDEILAVIFDLGNVLFDISFEPMLRQWSELSGKPFEELNAGFGIDEGVSGLYEKGLIDDTEFRKHLSQWLGFELSQEMFFESWNSIYGEPTEGIEELLDSLKANGYRLVALSNTNDAHYRVWIHKYAHLIAHLEKVFCSHLLRSKKPEPEIYKAVLDYLQLPPNQCVFLDDRADNVQGAIDLGIHGISVSTPQQMRNDLRKLGMKWCN